MFNDAQAEIAVAANRTIGESAVSQFPWRVSEVWW